ncbi:MAG: hypothetical protein CVU61_14420 [Deltaproteobacteria bacterium HGW-Deltaproteobacteria-19]|jgi:hypothetical protein|nr:MAG: hypothetical protein CVU61_14420 [Deltaproteobacteria bacterium HGW-Deltaproteobacteria-19]
MTAQEAAAKRSEKSQALKVWQVDETWFYVESDEGKVCYKVFFGDAGESCTCADFANRYKTDNSFKCKHILAVMNSIPKGEVLQALFLERRKPKLDERFIVTIDQKDFVVYSGLLDMAHQKNMHRMETELIQFPSKENDHTAICKAVAQTMNGGVFSDIGDANPTNCNSKVARHLIRMASTRAKARCLRDLTNIGMTALEELGDLTEVIGAKEEKVSTEPVQKDNIKRFPGRPRKQESANQKEEKSSPIQESSQSQQESQPPVTQDKPVEKSPARKSGDNGNGKSKVPGMSEAQKNAIFNLSRRRGISVEELEKMVQETYLVSLENLTGEDAKTFIRQLQQSA